MRGIASDSFELRAAIDGGRGASRPSNSEVLQQPAVVARLVDLLKQYEATALSLDTFRGRLYELGLTETPEVSKMLRQPQAISFRMFMHALNSGNEGLSSSQAFGVRGSAPAHIASNIEATGGSMRLTAREVHTSAAASSVLSTQESGVGMLLAGRGSELPAAATQPEVGDAGHSAAHSTHRARIVNSTAYIPSGAHAALRGEPDALPLPAAQQALAQVRQLLVRVDARALAQAEASQQLCAALGIEAPAAIPPLAAALADFYASRARTRPALRLDEALAACAAHLAAQQHAHAQQAPPGTPRHPQPPATGGASPKWSPQRAADFTESAEDRGSRAPLDSRVARRLGDPVAAANYARVFGESSGRLRDIHAVEVASAHLEVVSGGGGGVGGAGASERTRALLPMLNRYGVGGGEGGGARGTASVGLGQALQQQPPQQQQQQGWGAAAAAAAPPPPPEPLYASSGTWSGSLGARDARLGTGGVASRRGGVGEEEYTARVGGGGVGSFLSHGAGAGGAEEWPQRQGGRIGGGRDDGLGVRSHFGGGAGGGGILPGGGGVGYARLGGRR